VISAAWVQSENLFLKRDIFWFVCCLNSLCWLLLWSDLWNNENQIFRLAGCWRSFVNDVVVFYWVNQHSVAVGRNTCCSFCMFWTWHDEGPGSTRYFCEFHRFWHCSLFMQPTPIVSSNIMFVLENTSLGFIYHVYLFCCMLLMSSKIYWMNVFVFVASVS